MDNHKELVEISRTIGALTERIKIVEEEQEEQSQQLTEVRERLIGIQSHISSYNSKLSEFHNQDLPMMMQAIKEIQAEVHSMAGQAMEDRLKEALERERDRTQVEVLKARNEALTEDVKSQKATVFKLAGSAAGGGGIIFGLIEIIKSLLGS